MHTWPAAPPHCLLPWFALGVQECLFMQPGRETAFLRKRRQVPQHCTPDSVQGHCLAPLGPPSSTWQSVLHNTTQHTAALAASASQRRSDAAITHAPDTLACSHITRRSERRVCCTVCARCALTPWTMVFDACCCAVCAGASSGWPCRQGATLSPALPSARRGRSSGTGQGRRWCLTLPYRRWHGG